MKASQFKHLVLLFVLAGMLFSCASTTSLRDGGGELGSLLPENEDFYLFIRPKNHEQLMLSLLPSLFPEEGMDLSDTSIIKRIDLVQLSGSFPQEARPLSFSSVLSGSFPAYFVRRALKKSPYWEKQTKSLFQGPSFLQLETAYKDELLISSNQERLGQLTSPNLFKEAFPIKEDLSYWKEDTLSALYFYIPHGAALTLPYGLKPLPRDSSIKIDMYQKEGDEKYTMRAQMSFPDGRTMKFWSLGLRIYLAGRFGLSENPEERQVLETLKLDKVDNTLYVEGISLSTSAWVNFLDSFKKGSL